MVSISKFSGEISGVSVIHVERACGDLRSKTWPPFMWSPAAEEPPGFRQYPPYTERRWSQLAVRKTVLQCIQNR